MPWFFLILILWGQAASGSEFLCPKSFERLGDLKEISPESLSAIREPDEITTGANHKELLVAKLGEKDVFLKVSFAQSNLGGPYKNFEREARWLERLSQLKLGARFYGIVHLEQGFAAVTELIRGAHVDEIKSLQEIKTWLNQSTIRDLENIRASFEREGIIPMDFHFRINEQGHVFVIDPAFYLQKGVDVPLDFSQNGLGIIEQYLQAIRKLVEEKKNL